MITLSGFQALFLLLLASSLTLCHSYCRFIHEPNGHGYGGSLSRTTGKLGSSTVKGMFVFGSSLVDNGNNNFLKNIAKANYLPYGVDFRSGPSGRFTNGKNVVDLLGDHLRLPSYIPPFSDPRTKGAKVVHGVNFASGGSGILDDTGSLAGEVMSLRQQISAFEGVTLTELEGELGCRSRESLLHYLFVVGTGGNDYSLNYFLRNSNSSSVAAAAAALSDLQAFTSNLTGSLALHLQKLYNLGGRKFVVMSINPIGCSPSIMASRPSRGRCVQSLNIAAHLFNSNLRTLVDQLNSYLPDSHFILVSSYKIIRDIIKNPISKGFTSTGVPCCEVLTLEQGGNGILCRKDGRVCGNRSDHVFFDGLHPTEAVNVHIAAKAFSSLRTSEVYPFNVQRLASL